MTPAGTTGCCEGEPQVKHRIAHDNYRLIDVFHCQGT
jgi:hypothetical protein